MYWLLSHNFYEPSEALSLGYLNSLTSETFSVTPSTYPAAMLPTFMLTHKHLLRPENQSAGQHAQVLYWPRHLRPRFPITLLP